MSTLVMGLSSLGRREGVGDARMDMGKGKTNLIGCI
jgi:hypothetical protein